MPGTQYSSTDHVTSETPKHINHTQIWTSARLGVCQHRRDRTFIRLKSSPRGAPSHQALHCQWLRHITGRVDSAVGRAHGQTCRGVCPSVSRSGRVSDTGWSGGSSVMIMFSTLACRPACSRTPDASYMTCGAGVHERHALPFSASSGNAHTGTQGAALHKLAHVSQRKRMYKVQGDERSVFITNLSQLHAKIGCTVASAHHERED